GPTACPAREVAAAPGPAHRRGVTTTPAPARYSSTGDEWRCPRSAACTCEGPRDPSPGRGWPPPRSLEPDAQLARGRGENNRRERERRGPPPPGASVLQPLRDVQAALRDVPHEDVVGRLAGLGARQALDALADLPAGHLDPVALQDLAHQLVVRLDRLRDREIAVGTGAAAGPEVERRHLEEREVRLGGLEQDDVALEI